MELLDKHRKKNLTEGGSKDRYVGSDRKRLYKQPAIRLRKLKL